MSANGTQIVEEITEALSPAVPRLVMLNWQKQVDRLIMVDVLERIAEFCREGNDDSDPAILSKVVWDDFSKPIEERFFAVIVAVHEGKVIGHLLAVRDFYCGKCFVVVKQFSIDKYAGIPRGLLRAGFDMLADWANLHMAVEMRALVPTDAHARRLEIFYGFKRHRIMMSKEI
jgi:hypothetical protein